MTFDRDSGQQVVRNQRRRSRTSKGLVPGSTLLQNALSVAARQVLNLARRQPHAFLSPPSEGLWQRRSLIYFASIVQHRYKVETTLN